MCKSFGTSLMGPALTWFMHLQHGSISSFADLVNAFKIQFASSRKLEKQSSDLYHVIQRSNETLREYLNRYNKEKVSIPHCDVPTSIQAFRQGLVRGSELYRELTKYPCLSFEDVQAKAMAQIRLEEDEEPLKVNPSPDRVERRSNGDYRRDRRGQPYSRDREDRGRTTSGRDRGNA